MVQLTEDGPQIPKFFKGRSVFITGATGFLGKVLCERLLSTCPDIGDLYLLMRSKGDASAEKRLFHMKQSPVFDVIRRRNPRQLDKLRAVPGDLTEDMLGLTREDIARMKHVSVVFHSAASVKFNEKLSAAVDTNLRPVIRLLHICDTLPNLQVLMYISTAYSNSDLPRVEEKVYPPPEQLDVLMKVVENDVMGDEETAKYVSPKPNTYTFSKAMAEHVVDQNKNKKYSIAIFRPSIVISSLQNPFPGWLENYNGPTGVIVFSGRGIIRNIHGSGSTIGDVIPVDIAVDSMIAATWDTAMRQSPSLRVYNCSSYENPITWGKFTDYTNKHFQEYPLNNALWVPKLRVVKNPLMLKILGITMDIIPLYTLQYIIQILGIKSSINLIRAVKKFMKMQKVNSIFLMNEWQFETKNLRHLRETLPEKDREIYNIDPNSIIWEDYLHDYVRGIRKYLLNEKDEDLPAARKHMNRLRILKTFLKLFVAMSAVYFLLRQNFVKKFLLNL